MKCYVICVPEVEVFTRVSITLGPIGKEKWLIQEVEWARPDIRKKVMID
jgi:hypothetical protein